jgi:hypothetical protein
VLREHENVGSNPTIPTHLRADRVRLGLISPVCSVRVRGLQLPFGLLVQRDDAGIARRRSGFDSPAVH